MWGVECAREPHPGNLMVRTNGGPRSGGLDTDASRDNPSIQVHLPPSLPSGHRSFFHWLFRGSRQPFEIVVLDHGTYLTLTPELREQYCQLWCSFAACDVQV